MKKKKKSRRTREKEIKLIGLAVLVCMLAGLSYAVYRISECPAPKSFQIDGEATPRPVPEEQIVKAEEPTDIVTEMLAHIQPFYVQNPDTVGYIRIGDSAIDYPVVFSGDNEYYITHTFEKTESKEGAIFMDFRCDYMDFAKTRNVILYGHRMKDGSMFKGLTDYLDKDFYEQNRTIRFDTLYKEYEWEVFAVFETHVDFYYIETEFGSNEEWMAFMKSCYQRSKYQEETTFYPTDIVLTLSTCGLAKNKRFVVMARLKN